MVIVLGVVIFRPDREIRRRAKYIAITIGDPYASYFWVRRVVAEFLIALPVEGAVFGIARNAEGWTKGWAKSRVEVVGADKYEEKGHEGGEDDCR